MYAPNPRPTIHEISRSNVTFLPVKARISVSTKSKQIRPREKMMMLREFRSVDAAGSKRSFQDQRNVLHATCLLCRVMWPIFLQHRHLVPAHVSEAITLIGPRRRFLPKW